MLRLVILLSAILPSLVFGQKTEHWKGHLSVPLSHDSLSLFLTLHNDEGIISGISKTVNDKNGDSCVCTLSGTFDGDDFKLSHSKIISKKGPCCMSNFFLAQSENHLSGNWAGDLKLSTCPPGVKGKIELTRIPPSIIETTPLDAQELDSNNSKLIEALKNQIESKQQFALIIGNNTYTSNDIENLSDPVKNARDLKKTLVAKYHFKNENLIILENATRADIISGFEKLMKMTGSKSQVLVFFAGHGYWDKDLKQGYWIPSDADGTSHSNWISNSTIKDYLRGIPAQHTLVISDACFSGAIFKGRSLSPIKGETAIALYNLQSRKAMTSGTMSTVPDESIFMRHLLYSLNHNALNVLPAEELFSDLKFKVTRDSPNSQVPQYAPLNGVNDEGGSFIFIQ